MSHVVQGSCISTQPGLEDAAKENGQVEVDGRRPSAGLFSHIIWFQESTNLSNSLACARVPLWTDKN